MLDEPIVINKDNVTIKGLNPGFRSNIDVKDESLFGPGGGSKLILRKADAAIKLGNSDVSKLAIKNILISGEQRIMVQGYCLNQQIQIVASKI